eukprot:777948-Rhodomonas_salina.1
MIVPHMTVKILKKTRLFPVSAVQYQAHDEHSCCDHTDERDDCGRARMVCAVLDDDAEACAAQLALHCRNHAVWEMRSELLCHTVGPHRDVVDQQPPVALGHAAPPAFVDFAHLRHELRHCLHRGTFLPTDTEIRKIVQGVRLGPPMEVEPGAEGAGEEGAAGELPCVFVPKDNEVCKLARALDCKYVKDVIGGSMVLDMSHGWTSDNPLSTTMDQTIFAKVLAEVLDRVGQQEMRALSAKRKKVHDMAVLFKSLIVELREAWEECDNFEVSYKIVAAENSVMKKLRNCGLFSALVSKVSVKNDTYGHTQWKNLRFVLRRSNACCVQFALAVGSQLLETVNLSASKQTSITEHRLGVNRWDDEFEDLLNTARTHEREIMSIVTSRNADNGHLVVDYVEKFKMQLKNREKREAGGEEHNVDPDKSIWQPFAS